MNKEQRRVLKAMAVLVSAAFPPVNEGRPDTTRQPSKLTAAPACYWLGESEIQC